MSDGELSDRYAVDRRLAGQIEAEWGDVLLGDFLEAAIPAARRLGFSRYLARPAYHPTVAHWVASAIAAHEVRTAVDIGAGLGRFLFELLQDLPEIESATYVEPSPSLHGWANGMLTPGSAVARVPFVTALGKVGWHEYARPVSLDEERLRKIRMVYGSADAPFLKGAQFDLVTALNVLDQCAYPTMLAERAKALVSPKGYVAFSCTHQFQQRFFIDAATVFESLHDLFQAAEWTLVAERELPFVFRMGDRHRNEFLSHHVLYRRVA